MKIQLFFSFRAPSFVIWYYCTWWTRAPSTERGSLKSSASSMNSCICTYFNNLKWIIFKILLMKLWLLSHTVCNRRDQTKNKDEKTGHRERRARKPAAEKVAANSVKNPEEKTELTVETSPTEEGAVGKRGPTIPRNTGQRYSAILSQQGAGPKHHITFSSHK